MSAHQSSGSLFIITCFILMSGEVKTQSVSSDPCNSYTVLDNPWRATNYSNALGSMCDRSVTWVGWYRLMYYGKDVRMPETCVNINRCGTDAPLWINGIHPQVVDGIVTRPVCGNWNSNCCNFVSNPIRIKACQGNYYVYEFVSPVSCSLAYCADVTTAIPAATVPPVIKHLAGLRMTLSSAVDFTKSSSSGIFLKQLKDDLVRKGLPANITLHLKSISKWTDVKLATLNSGAC